MAAPMSLDDLVVELFKIEAVKFGDFTLKSGIQSPVYFDLRVIVSYPKLLAQVSEHLWQAANGAEFVSVCGVPYTALPLATQISVTKNVPMLIRRKEAKDYGTKKLIEGKYQAGDLCLIIEDVVTSGSSVWETVEALNSQTIACKDAVVLLNREQGGRERLQQQGINLRSVCTVTQVLEILQKRGLLQSEMVENVKRFITENRIPLPSNADSAGSNQSKKSVSILSYSERRKLCSNLVTQKLFSIMEDKQTNLAVAADVTSCDKLLKLARQVAPYICILKVHVDILEDFTLEFTKQLKEIATTNNFLIFEDRKFADIGNTVKHQFEGGMYRIADWADIVNAHALPGPGIIHGLKEASKSRNCGCLLIGEMSSKGSLAVGDYTKASTKMAEENKDFVIGFISQSQLSSDPQLVHMTPGVKLQMGGDSLGQQYLTPQKVITEKGSDIIIVGRGITEAADPSQAALEYKEAGYQAFMERLATS